MLRPKMTVALLVGGTAILVGGTVAAVELPSHGEFWRPSTMKAALPAAAPSGSDQLQPADGGKSPQHPCADADCD